MLDLTPTEVVRLVQGITAIPDNLMFVNESDQLSMWHDDKHTLSLAEKINAQGEREDVIAYMKEHYEITEAEGESE